MYLHKKHYVKNWEHNKEKYTFLIKRGGKEVDYINHERIDEISEEVMYWRKANAIHNWFVENVQGGEDDCKEYYVSRGDLIKLLDTCEKVIAGSELVDGKVKNGETFINGEWVADMEEGKTIKDPSIAQELLPTQSGFFFGGTDYDEWYLQDIKDTARELKKELAIPEGGSYYYSSSW